MLRNAFTLHVKYIKYTEIFKGNSVHRFNFNNRTFYEVKISFKSESQNVRYFLKSMYFILNKKTRIHTDTDKIIIDMKVSKRK